jgi:hypothetical protein
VSESVVDSGRLIPITLTTFAAKEECERLGVSLEHYDDPLDALVCETEEYANIAGLGFCRVENFETADPTDSWCTLTKNGDGSYNFRASYYNGGAHWTELVESVVKNER